MLLRTVSWPKLPLSRIAPFSLNGFWDFPVEVTDGTLLTVDSENDDAFAILPLREALNLILSLRNPLKIFIPMLWLWLLLLRTDLLSVTVPSVISLVVLFVSAGSPE